MGWRQKLDTYLGIRAPGGRGQVTIDANTGTTSTLTVDSLAAGAGTVGTTELAQQFVVATATLTSAAGSTPVEIVADATVGAGRAFYLCGWRAVVNGGTLWGTVTNVYIKDNAGSPVTLVDIPVAALGANAIVGELTANVALGTPVITGAGATTAKGLNIVANATGTGSDLIVTVWGLVK